VREGSFRQINTKLTALIIFGLVRSVMFFHETDKSAEETAEEVFSVVDRGILAIPHMDLIYSKEITKRSEIEQKSRE